MSKKNIVLISGIIVVIVALVIFSVLNILKKNEEKDEVYNVTSLAELFPEETTKQLFTDGTEEYEVSVKEVTSKEGVTTIVTEYVIEVEGTVTTVQTTYEITSEKVVESGKYISSEGLVSISYPTDLILGVPYLNMTWKSIDGLITNTVVSIVNNKVTIESIRLIDIYEGGETTPIEKEYKETRVYEKGKGIVLFRTEIEGDDENIYERKIVE